MLVSPMSDLTILGSILIYGASNGLLTSFIVVVIALFFTTFSVFSWWIVISVAFLCALLFSSIGLINALLVKHMKI